MMVSLAIKVVSVTGHNFHADVICQFYYLKINKDSEELINLRARPATVQSGWGANPILYDYPRSGHMVHTYSLESATGPTCPMYMEMHALE